MVQQPLDGFTIRRTGDQPTKVRLIMYLEQTPEHYKVAPELGIFCCISYVEALNFRDPCQATFWASKKRVASASSRLCGITSKYTVYKINQIVEELELTII